MQKFDSTRYVIIREVYSAVAKKTQYEVVSIFETNNMADAVITLNQYEEHYPDDKISIYIKLS